MDLLRAALGDKKLNYLGFSYGTYLGTLYAQQFPDTVGRFVLDGAIDPTISIEAQTRVQAVAFDQALSHFITDCSKQNDCPLPTNATPQFFTDLFATVSKQPLTTNQKLSTGQPRTITEGLVVTGTASALYDDVRVGRYCALQLPKASKAMAQVLQNLPMHTTVAHLMARI